MAVTIEKSGLKVGQVVYLEPLGNAARYSTEIKPATICSLGKKYFAVEEFPRNRFSIEELIHDGGQYSPQYKVHLSLQDIQDEKEANKLSRELAGYFGHHKAFLTLTQLKKIKEIING